MIYKFEIPQNLNLKAGNTPRILRSIILISESILKAIENVFNKCQNKILAIFRLKFHEVRCTPLVLKMMVSFFIKILKLLLIEVASKLSEFK